MNGCIKMQIQVFEMIQIQIFSNYSNADTNVNVFKVFKCKCKCFRKLKRKGKCLEKLHKMRMFCLTLVFEQTITTTASTTTKTTTT